MCRPVVPAVSYGGKWHRVTEYPKTAHFDEDSNTLVVTSIVTGPLCGLRNSGPDARKVEGHISLDSDHFCRSCRQRIKDRIQQEWDATLAVSA